MRALSDLLPVPAGRDPQGTSRGRANSQEAAGAAKSSLSCPQEGQDTPKAAQVLICDHR